MWQRGTEQKKKKKDKKKMKQVFARQGRVGMVQKAARHHVSSCSLRITHSTTPPGTGFAFFKKKKKNQDCDMQGRQKLRTGRCAAESHLQRADVYRTRVEVTVQGRRNI